MKTQMDNLGGFLVACAPQAGGHPHPLPTPLGPRPGHSERPSVLVLPPADLLLGGPG